MIITSSRADLNLGLMTAGVIVIMVDITYISGVQYM